MKDRKAPPRWMLTDAQANALKERFGWEIERKNDLAFYDAVVRSIRTKDGSRLAADKGAR